jgi:hypothetical protein
MRRGALGSIRQGIHRSACRPALALSVLALALAALALPPTARGATLSYWGGIGAGGGPRVNEQERLTSFDAVGGALLSLTATEGPVSGRVQLIFGQLPEETQSIEHEMVWSPTDSFRLTLSGHSFGLLDSRTNTSVVNFPDVDFGDVSAAIDFRDTGMLDAQVGGPAAWFGLSLLDSCIPECGYALYDPGTGTAGPVNPSAGRMTVLLHVRGTNGSVRYNAYAARSSGRFEDPALPAQRLGGVGLAAGLGGMFRSGEFRIGMDLSASQVQCNPAAGTTACVDDTEERRGAVGVVYAGAGVHYFYGKRRTGTDVIDLTNVDLAYVASLDNVLLGPELRWQRLRTTGEADLTEAWALFTLIIVFGDVPKELDWH